MSNKPTPTRVPVRFTTTQSISNDINAHGIDGWFDGSRYWSHDMADHWNQGEITGVLRKRISSPDAAPVGEAAPITVAVLAKAADRKIGPIMRALNVFGGNVTLNQPIDLALIGAALSHAGCALATPVGGEADEEWPDARNRGVLQAAKQALAALKRHGRLPWGQPGYPTPTPGADLLYEARSYLEPAIKREEEFRSAVLAASSSACPSPAPETAGEPQRITPEAARDFFDEVASSPEKARAFLIKHGFLTAQGKLHPNYGGDELGKRTGSTAPASGHELPDAGESRNTAIVSPEGATDAVANRGDARTESSGCAHPSTTSPDDLRQQAWDEAGRRIRAEDDGLPYRASPNEAAPAAEGLTQERIKALAERHLSYVFTSECEEVVSFARAIERECRSTPPAAPAGAEPTDLALDAELGRTAMRFVDRAGDVCEQDPAERICEQFHAEMVKVIERHVPLRCAPSIAAAPAAVADKKESGNA